MLQSLYHLQHCKGDTAPALASYPEQGSVMQIPSQLICQRLHEDLHLCNTPMRTAMKLPANIGECGTCLKMVIGDSEGGRLKCRPVHHAFRLHTGNMQPCWCSLQKVCTANVAGAYKLAKPVKLTAVHVETVQTFY